MFPFKLGRYSGVVLDAVFVRSPRRRRPDPAQPGDPGPADPPAGRRQSDSDAADGRILRPARLGRADHLRSHLGHAPGRRLRRLARDLVPGAGRGLERGDPGGEGGRRKIAFICAREHVGPDSLGPQLKQAFGGVYIANEGFDGAGAQAALDAGWADAVAFGKAFLANPDLPARLRAGAPLNPPRPESFYGPGAEGYVDYPALEPVG